jgi:hypothetical protein
MCSFSEFYFNSPDGVKVVMVTLPFLTVVTSVWLWTRYRAAVCTVRIPEAEFRAAVAEAVALLLLRNENPAIEESDDSNCPPQLNLPEGTEED